MLPRSPRARRAQKAAAEASAEAYLVAAFPSLPPAERAASLPLLPSAGRRAARVLRLGDDDPAGQAACLAGLLTPDAAAVLVELRLRGGWADVLGSLRRGAALAVELELAAGGRGRSWGILFICLLLTPSQGE